MRPHINTFFKVCAEILPCPEPIVEVGAYQVAGQESIADLRPYFPGKAYIGCDMRPGRGVDRIEDIHDLSFRDGEVGTFLLADTLEHVWHPHLAFSELHRCLRDDGVAIFTSIMHFPIHSYPEDYWRFTPETFRELAKSFAHTVIFYGGDPNFPHSVCGVATKAGYNAAYLRQLVEPLGRVDTQAPHHFEGHARHLIRHLALKLTATQSPAEPVHEFSPEAMGGFDAPVSTRGWILTPGQWLQGWAITDGAQTVEVRAGDQLIHRAELSLPRPDIAARLGLDSNEQPIGFRDQIDLSGLEDITGTLQLVVVDGEGRRTVVAESAPGLLIGTIQPPSGFVLHSFDERPVDEKRLAARRLVESIRAGGEKIVVDLGCGFRKEGTLGIDVQAEGTDADLICNLGFEPIPLDDESVDEVFCRDFLEHLPKGVYSERQGRMFYPVIELINEVWRILKPGGVFTSFTPCYPNVETHQDPTHLSVWTLKSMEYFCGKYPVAQSYGVKARFELLENRMDKFYLYAKLRKPASVMDPREVGSTRPEEA